MHSLFAEKGRQCAQHICKKLSSAALFAEKWSAPSHLHFRASDHISGPETFSALKTWPPEPPKARTEPQRQVRQGTFALTSRTAGEARRPTQTLLAKCPWMPSGQLDFAARDASTGIAGRLELAGGTAPMRSPLSKPFLCAFGPMLVLFEDLPWRLCHSPAAAPAQSCRPDSIRSRPMPLRVTLRQATFPRSSGSA